MAGGGACVDSLEEELRPGFQLVLLHIDGLERQPAQQRRNGPHHGRVQFTANTKFVTRHMPAAVRLRPVYTCDFAYKTRLTLPCTNAFFREASRGLERKLSHIISRHPSFQFLLNWRYFVAELRDYKPVRGRLWQVLYAKSH